MPDPDLALTKLKLILEEFSGFCERRGGASETDTRIKLIDRVLIDVLGWPEANISREDHVNSGYIDYCLSVNGGPLLAVEAKREDAAFVIAVKHNDPWYNLDGVLVTAKPIKDAIDQVRAYCDDHDPPIRYAIATNGYTWIVFRAIRDDMGWRKGRARVFQSIKDVASDFIDFWNLLAYPLVATGSLTLAFSQTTKASRRLDRVNQRLYNSDSPLLRNHLNNPLRPLISTIFENIADQAQIEILNSCYVHSQSLKVVAKDLDDILTGSIPKFLAIEGTKSVGADDAEGGFSRSLAKSFRSGIGRLYLLLGGIGSGKTTFVKRYQRTTGKELLDSSTLWFSIDFLKAPMDPAELERFAWASIIKDLRKKYSSMSLEKLSRLRLIFAGNILVLESTVLSGLKVKSSKYDEILKPYLSRWQEDLAEYIPQLLKISCKEERLKPVLFIDNVDQLAPEYQAQIFLLSQRICRLLESITLVSLREESYYSASVQKAFTAFTTNKFHVASPKFREMIASRISYAIKLLSQPVENGEEETEEQIHESMANFLQIVKGSIFDSNRRITRFIEAICHGNMRFALELFTSFLTSGATDAKKMLRIYSREGNYNVAFHEFVKSIMLGDRRYYNEDQSPIMNMFNVGSQQNASHFTSWRLIRVLLSHRSESSIEGRGYVSLARLLVEFEEVFDNRDDVIFTLTRLLNRRLIESNTRSSDTLDKVSHVRITSAGWYYCRYLVPTFAYMDLILQDTPLDDPDVEKQLRDSVVRVDNLSDREDEKVERVYARFERVDKFIGYLLAQESAERKKYSLGKMRHPLADDVMLAIRKAFHTERDWIKKRLGENRGYFEDLPQYFDNEEARSFGLADDA